MALTQRLEIRQSQALVMTPQLMQAIKLLQLSNLELASYVDGELERNPLLERVAEGEPANGEPAGAEPEPAPPVEEIAKPGDWLGQDLEVSRSDIEDRLGTRLDNVFPDDGDRAGRASGRRRAGTAIPNGRARAAAAAATTAITISRPSSPPRPRSPTISPSSWRSPWPIPPAA